MRKVNSSAYNREYYLAHRDELLAKRRIYQVAHWSELCAGERAYYRGRKALDVVKVETLFDGVQPLLMRRGHRYLTKKSDGL
jgi:hypothetical protein